MSRGPFDTGRFPSPKTPSPRRRKSKAGFGKRRKPDRGAERKMDRPRPIGHSWARVKAGMERAQTLVAMDRKRVVVSAFSSPIGIGQQMRLRWEQDHRRWPRPSSPRAATEINTRNRDGVEWLKNSSFTSYSVKSDYAGRACDLKIPGMSF